MQSTPHHRLRRSSLACPEGITQESFGKEVDMLKNLLIEIIEEIQSEADEILEEKQTDYDDGLIIWKGIIL